MAGFGIDTERSTVTKHLFPAAFLVMLILATVAAPTPAVAQTPSYIPPPNWNAPPKHPGPGGANTFICADWLSKHAARFNNPADPVAAIP